MTNLLLLGFLPSGSEWIIIALVILLLFGGKKIPEPTNRNHIEGRTGTDECARQHEVQCCPNPVR